MKKNKIMRLASFLLVAVMLSTCAISGTFAKYVTSGSATDSARVAKWGVAISVTGNDAFKTEYTTDDTSATSITNSVVTSSAEGADGKNLVAPGTSGTLATYSISGTPEVATKTTVSATLTLTGWDIPAPTTENPDATDFYCPIVIKVGSTDYSGLSYDSAEAFASAVQNAIAVSTYNAPNTSVASSNTVTWAWAFDASGNQTDVKDTALGDLTTAPTITFALSVTVDQVN